jgi:hypothetical protein
VKLTALWVLFGMMMLESSAGAQQPSALGGKMTATAIVVLTREFCTVTANKRIFPMPFVPRNEAFVLGRLLCPAAEEAARSSFGRVIRMETAPKPQDAGGHLVLIPRYVDMEATDAPTTIQKRKMALLVEWTATDPSGKVLWVQTVEGDARKAAGFNHRKLLETAVGDVGEKSTEAIEKSQEIRHFLEASAGN